MPKRKLILSQGSVENDFDTEFQEELIEEEDRLRNSTQKKLSGNSKQRPRINNQPLMNRITDEITSELPWIETLSSSVGSNIPKLQDDQEFAKKQGLQSKEILIKDVNDDFEREVAFYDHCSEYTGVCKKKFKELGVAFERPDDFFAEMVKSDNHMSLIKDRLVFERKKVEAVETRKRKQTEKKYVKELIGVKRKEKKDEPFTYKRGRERSKFEDNNANDGEEGEEKFDFGSTERSGGRGRGQSFRGRGRGRSRGRGGRGRGRGGR